MRLRPRLDGLILGKAGTGGMGSSPATSLFPLVPGVGESPSPPRVTESPLRLQGQGWTAVSAHHGRVGAHPSSGMKASASPELYQTQVPGKGLLPCGARDTWRVGPAPAHLPDARTHGSMCRPAHTQCTSRMHRHMHMYAHIQSKHTCTCIRACSACPHSVTHSCVHNAHTHTQCTSCTHTRTCTYAHTCNANTHAPTYTHARPVWDVCFNAEKGAREAVVRSVPRSRVGGLRGGGGSDCRQECALYLQPRGGSGVSPGVLDLERTQDPDRKLQR